MREYFLTTNDRELWRRFLPENTGVYGSLAYAEIGERFLGRVHRLYVIERENGWIAHPMLLRPISTLPFTAVTSAIWDSTTPEYTGPHCFGSVTISAQEYQHRRSLLARQHGIVADFGHLQPWSGAETLLQDGISYDRDVIWIDTTLEPEFLWRNHLEHRCRKCINKAEREGVFTIEASSDSDIKEFLRIYEGTMSRNNALQSYYFAHDYFVAFRRCMPENSRFILTVYRDRVIGALFALFDQESVYAYLGGSDVEYHHLHPASFQIWEMARWAHMTGKKRVVLGGGYSPNDGIYKFKAAFSPLRKAFYVYKKIYQLEDYARLEQASRRFNGVTDDEELTYFPSYRYVRPQPLMCQSVAQSN